MRLSPSVRRPPGISLTELLIALAVLAILAAAAAPSFWRDRQRALAITAADRLLGGLHQTRSVALLEATAAVLCLSSDGQQCLATGLSEASGWIAFRNTHSESPPRRDAGESFIAAVDFGASLRLSGSRNAVTYWPTARAGTTTTLTICSGRPAIAARQVIVSQVGRPRLKTLSTQAAGCR